MIENAGWSRLFESGGGEREFRIEVNASGLPVYSGGKELYESGKRRTLLTETGLVSYYREPNRQWQFCYEEHEGSGSLTVVPEFSRYVRDIRNIWDKIDLSRILLGNGALILHASYIIWNGQAILFTAPSGTGKSTQAELWERHRGADIINGDRAVIRRKGHRLWAYSLPFAGSSGICSSRNAPLSAIVVLGQAKENRISRLSMISAVKHMYTQCALNRWNPEEAEAVSGILGEMARDIPVLKLDCLPDAGAVDTLEHYLKEL